MDRRSFIVGTACALLTPSFMRDATRTIERTSSPMLVAPDNPTRTLFALRGRNPVGTGFFYDLRLDRPDEDPNDDFFYMTWREYIAARGYHVGGKDRALANLLLEHYEDHLALNGETNAERLREARILLDEPANEDCLLDAWKSWGSPSGKAYHELFNLDLGPDPRLHRGTGSIEFIDSPSVGYYASSVEVDGCLSLSLLQGRLSELKTGFNIEVRDL